MRDDPTHMHISYSRQEKAQASLDPVSLTIITGMMACLAEQAIA